LKKDRGKRSFKGEGGFQKTAASADSLTSEAASMVSSSLQSPFRNRNLCNAYERENKHDRGMGSAGDEGRGRKLGSDSNEKKKNLLEGKETNTR